MHLFCVCALPLVLYIPQICIDARLFVFIFAQHDFEKSRVRHDQEEKLIISAWYNMVSAAMLPSHPFLVFCFDWPLNLHLRGWLCIRKCLASGWVPLTRPSLSWPSRDSPPWPGKAWHDTSQDKTGRTLILKWSRRKSDSFSWPPWTLMPSLNAATLFSSHAAAAPWWLLTVQMVCFVRSPCGVCILYCWSNVKEALSPFQVTFISFCL